MRASAISKKRRDNDTRKKLLRARGAIDGAISDGDCFEDCLRLAEFLEGGPVAPHHYARGMKIADELVPAIEKFERALGLYGAGLDAAKDALETEAP